MDSLFIVLLRSPERIVQVYQDGFNHALRLIDLPPPRGDGHGSRSY